MTGSNLPPGVSVGMLPGNTPEDVAFEKFCEWACDEFADSNHRLDITECYMAVRAGIAAVKASREDIMLIVKEQIQEEKITENLARIEEDEQRERELRERFERESG